jgi:hypothetical protein
MENIIGWLLILLIPVAITFVLVWGIKRIKRRQLEKLQKVQDDLDRKAKEREAWRQKLRGATHVGKTTYDFNADKNRTVVKNQVTGSTVSYVHTRDDGPDILTTMIVADLLNNSKSSSSGSVSWSNDIPSVDTDDKKSSWSSDIGSSSWDSGPSSSSSWD